MKNSNFKDKPNRCYSDRSVQNHYRNKVSNMKMMTNLMLSLFMIFWTCKYV